LNEIIPASISFSRGEKERERSMRRSVWFGVFGALMIACAMREARADTCPGDCGGAQAVLINNLITCVSIDLGTQPVTACPACDVNGDMMVEVNEIVAAVNAALFGCPGAPTPTPGAAPICGNGIKETDEDCDPPNVGNGCAANCTTETRRMATLDPNKSLSPIQTLAGVLGGTHNEGLHTSGTQVLTTGRARDAAVMGPGGVQLFAPGEAPIVIKAEDVKFDPINVLGLACACVRAIPVAAFGEGISGVGVTGCGDKGLTDVDFLVEQDHDTNPASPGDSGTTGTSLSEDPSCTAKSSTGPGGSLSNVGAAISSTACLEGVGENCSGVVGSPTQYSNHFAVPSCVGGADAGMMCSVVGDCGAAGTCVGGMISGMTCQSDGDCGGGTCTAPVCKSAGTKRPAACNSPRVYTFSGGQAPRGAVLLINSTSQTLLPNVAVDACKATMDAHGACSAPAFGKDCIPCTDDDVLFQAPMIVPTTSGTARIKVYDANDGSGGTAKGTVLGDGVMCAGKPCIGSVTGIGADCDALKNDPSAPLSGALVTASPTLDSQVGDVVLTTTLQAQTP
jgi:hypothetical protein